MNLAFCHRLAVVVSLCVISAELPYSNIVHAAPEPLCCGPITPAGDRLAATLDSMNVESLWLSHEHVNWETGEPDRGGVDEGEGHHTHCSAFAASAAEKLSVYLLRPPEHGQVLLANAQAQWLPSDDGRKAGWRGVADMREAQRLANLDARFHAANAVRSALPLLVECLDG